MKIIFIGAKPDFARHHPGGQSTAAYGLFHYCSENNIRLDIIDSAQESFPFPSLYKRLFRAFKRIILCLSALCFNRYDGVIIFSGSGLSFFEKIILAMICRLFFTKCIFFVRDGFFMSECKVPWRRMIYRYLLRIPNFLGSQGASWSQLYKSLGVSESRIVLIPNWLSPLKHPCDLPKVYAEDIGAKLTFLFVGWIVEPKGVRDIIDAIESSEVLERHQFLLAGDGDLRVELEERCKARQLKNIYFLGWQSSDRIEELMRSSDVFVFPSHAEGFPNVIVEALAAALPIVSTGVGGIEDSAIHEHNAFIVPVRDANALKDALESLAANSGLRGKFSENSLRIFNERHVLKSNCSKMMDLFL